MAEAQRVGRVGVGGLLGSCARVCRDVRVCFAFIRSDENYVVVCGLPQCSHL